MFKSSNKNTKTVPPNLLTSKSVLPSKCIEDSAGAVDRGGAQECTHSCWQPLEDCDTALFHIASIEFHNIVCHSLTRTTFVQCKSRYIEMLLNDI